MFRYFLIFTLALGLGALLYFQPWKGEIAMEVSIEDRLPDGEIIGTADVLSLSNSMSKTLFYYKIPFREFLTPDFILSQGKNYGLDLQTPIFFFANQSEIAIDEWGMLISVKDSSKVSEGIDHLKKFVDIKSSILFNTTVYQSSDYPITMAYGPDWMFVYSGENFTTSFKRVVSAKHDQISRKWKQFIDDISTTDNCLTAQIYTPSFDEYGIESSLVSLSNDSSSLIFNTTLNSTSPLSFSLKSSGPKYYAQEFTKRLVNVHFDTQKVRDNEDDPLYNLLRKSGSKISFPVDDFLKSWTGDISFRQGGIQNIRESYIESELDENFNVTEVTKFRNVKISGFTLYLSMNANRSSFIDKLLEKGILTQEKNKYRLLYSPPVYMKESDTSLVFHTSRYLPEIVSDSTNEIVWSFNYTPVSFMIDSTSARSVYGKVQIPLKKIIKDNIPGIEFNQNSNY